MAEGASPPSDIPPDLLFLSSAPPLTSSSASIEAISPTVSIPASPPLPCAPLSGCPPVSSSEPSATSLPDKSTSWISNFKPQFKNLTKIGSPTMSSDGIPQIQAPDSIVLSSAQIWKNHIVAYFHGNPPSVAKIFSDLNPIWGLKGLISIKHHSPGVFLILIPNLDTRNWVLDVGFWHSGNCSITVTPWEPSSSTRRMKLVHAPVWVLFRRVPPELWSEVGFSTIASAVGIPVHSKFPNIKPYSNGVVKLRANSIRIKDKFGNFALVLVEVLKLPPKCSNCREFGHLELRFPSTIVPLAPMAQLLAKSSTPSKGTSSPRSVPATSKEVLVVEDSESNQEAQDVHSSSSVQDHLSPSTSSTVIVISEDAPVSDPLDGYTKVTKRSKPPTVSQTSSENARRAQPVTSSQFGEEEDVNKSAQVVIRNRFKALQSMGSFPTPLLIPKMQRRVQRQQARQISSSLTTRPPPDPEEVDSCTSVSSFASPSEHPRLAGALVTDS
ncbi:unnamed protein product [Microthlaspi erraticum]|uniref:DUF4283 domain-containing protein n=1 Tax=Microthlaspi erraticum TaxID=1685480 RepID=A0A6D2KN44_9BRAS|nr:unnamed protein product [Microthlaspi erraticum]